MGGSQLKQLKAAINTSGVSRNHSDSRKRKRRSHSGGSGSVVDHRDKRAEKLREIHETFNPFDVKVEKLKHDTGGRKIKGTIGKPGASKQAGLEQRKKTLLVEYEKKAKSGGVVDRRFGEDDPTMTLEERMLARFTKERQRSSKAAMFNLEDDTELTHYGRSLSNLDDFDNVGLTLNDADEDDAGQIDAATVKSTHFKGFSDEEEEEDDGPPRKKTKAEVMAEVVAKSKEHKYARQLQREQDESTRHELDEDFDAIRGMLFPKSSPAKAPPLPTPKPTPASGSTNAQSKPAMDRDYDTFVRELAMDKRAQPKDRTKTEEELALEEKNALELAERKRLKRMMGEPEESEDEDGKSRKRKRGGDDLDDDFLLDDDLISGLGTGLNTVGVDEDEEHPEESQEDEDEDEEEDGDEEEEANDDDATMDGNSEEEADNYGDSDEGEEAEEGPIVELVPRKLPKTSARVKIKGEIPFTFACPSSHEEFLEILDGVELSQVGLVVERIRKLHHPSLHVDNKTKLQAFIGVLLDHIIFSAGTHPLPLQIIEELNGHLLALSKAYPMQSAEHFVSKLNILQKNLVRGLQDPLASSSKTFPEAAELVFLRVLGATWSTSDLKHSVVSPARYLMGAYLGLGRVRNIKDIASGLYLCSLFMQYEDFSKRLVPEAINFTVQSLLLLSSSSYTNAKSIPGSFPVPDIDIIGSKLHFKLKKARDIAPGQPRLFDIVNETLTGEQPKLDLLCTALELIRRFAEVYKPLDGFIELFSPIVDILQHLIVNKLPTSVHDRLSQSIDHLSRLLKFAKQARKPLFLQAHKPIPIATYIPKFDAHSSS
ncbi:nucleolar complex protein 14, partial [Serendipita sp. 397]